MITRLVAFAGRHPWWWLLAYLLLSAALYQTAIRVPLYAPFIVQPTALDDAIPLLPWTAAPYLTYFLLMPSFVWLTLRHPQRGALLIAAGLVVIGNLTINILVPTEIADPLTAAYAQALDAPLLAQVIAGDMPRAAIPSGHVALPMALAMLAFRARLPGRWLYVAWTLIMAVSILTTKQHYLPDALGGLAWGALGPLLSWRWVMRGSADPGMDTRLGAA